LVVGDALTHLKSLPDGIVQCCVTSPPYYGLRDYGTGKWEGGTDPTCDHGVQRWDGPKQTQGAQSGHASKADRLARRQCASCGAHRVDDQLGLEETPHEYIARLVEIFREVRRVLRDDGTLWLNLGDSYANDGKWGGSTSGKHAGALHGDTKVGRGKRRTGFKAKELMMIPARAAIALQDDGWYLRSDIVWAKGNPMPESVKDRPTRSHEYVFLLAKSERYFYDTEAVKEVAAEGGHRNRRSVWGINPKPYKGAHFAVMPEELARLCILAGSKPGDMVLDPFSGSGTTLAVARLLGRSYLGIELNPEYVPLINERVRVTSEYRDGRDTFDFMQTLPQE